MLQKISSYPPRKQSQIISACCALQNFVRLSGIRDRHFARCDRDENYVPREATEDQPDTDPVPSSDDSDLMNQFRDDLAHTLFNRD
jgi:hypothetical protein